MASSIIKIGDGFDARIALYLNWDSAWAIADAFPSPDRAYGEMVDAIERAWPARWAVEIKGQPACYVNDECSLDTDGDGDCYVCRAG